MTLHADFQHSWGTREVGVQVTGTRASTTLSPESLTLDGDTLTSSTVPDQHIAVRTAQPGSPSQKGLQLLAAAAARQSAPAPALTGNTREDLA